MRRNARAFAPAVEAKTGCNDGPQRYDTREVGAGKLNKALVANSKLPTGGKARRSCPPFVLAKDRTCTYECESANQPKKGALRAQEFVILRLSLTSSEYPQWQLMHD